MGPGSLAMSLSVHRLRVDGSDELQEVGKLGNFLGCGDLRPGNPGEVGRPGPGAYWPSVSPTLQINAPHFL